MCLQPDLERPALPEMTMRGFWYDSGAAFPLRTGNCHLGAFP